MFSFCTHPSFSIGDISGLAKEARKFERKQRPKTRDVLERDNSRFDCAAIQPYVHITYIDIYVIYVYSDKACVCATRYQSL